MQSITYSITNLKFTGLVNLQFWAWFFFCNGKFSEKTSVYGEFFHMLNVHDLCRGHSNSVLKEAEMRRDRDSLGKQELLHLLLLRDIRQGGNCISWGRAGHSSFHTSSCPTSMLQWQQPAPLCKQSKQQGYKQFVILHQFRPALPAHRAE